MCIGGCITVITSIHLAGRAGASLALGQKGYVRQRVGIIMPTELVSEELIPGAAKLPRDSSPQVWTNDSSSWLGRTMAAAPESPLVTSNDLPMGGITDSSTMMSPAVAISDDNHVSALEIYRQVSKKDSIAMISPAVAMSIDNHGSVLPDAFNSGDALETHKQVLKKDSIAMISPAVAMSIDNHGSVLPDAFNSGDAWETYEQVSKKASANPNVIRGCSCRSSSMGMLKCTRILQLRQFRPSTVRWTTSKELRETTKELNAEIYDSDCLQKAKERIHTLQQELRNSTNLDLQEQFKQNLIQAIHNLYVLRLGSSSFIENFGSESMSTKLVSEELIPGAAKLSSDSPVEVGTSNTSGWLGGTIAAPSTSPQVSANPNAVGGHSCKSSFMRMLKCKTLLQPHPFRPSTVRWTSKKLKETIKDLNTKVFQSDALQKAKECIASLQQKLTNSTNLILNEHSKLTSILLAQMTFRMRLEHTFCIKDSGPKIISMEKTLRENGKILKGLHTGLILNFDHTDSLFSKVKDIQKKNKDASKVACRLSSGWNDYESRMSIESSWLWKFANTVRDFSSNLPPVISEINELQKEFSKLSEILDVLASWKHTSQDYDSQLCALRTILVTLQSIDIQSKNVASLLEAAADYCFICMNLRSVHHEKIKFSERFLHFEQDVSQYSPKLEETISDLRLEVDRINRSYIKKLSSIPKDRQSFDIKSHTFQKVIGHSDFSWRFRKYNSRSITPTMRTQGRDECSSVSTVSTTESLYKKQHATEITVGDNVYQADEFIIQLSHNHLQDIVGQFYKMNKRKGNEKLAVCFEQMEEKGVVSESAYNNKDGDAKVEDFERYRINGFEELNIADFDGACAKLKEGGALVGNFRVTTGYHDLGPNDIYDIPADAVYQTTPSGLVCSHCVVIVGFGVTPEGQGYYVFQNSYGPDWGSGGYGRVSSKSLKYLYAPTL